MKTVVLPIGVLKNFNKNPVAFYEEGEAGQEGRLFDIQGSMIGHYLIVPKQGRLTAKVFDIRNKPINEINNTTVKIGKIAIYFEDGIISTVTKSGSFKRKRNVCGYYEGVKIGAQAAYALVYRGISV